MAYQSSESKKEEFRKYLEKSNVLAALTKVLVSLYEEPDRPDKPVEFIKKALGGPSQVRSGSPLSRFHEKTTTNAFFQPVASHSA